MRYSRTPTENMMNGMLLYISFIPGVLITKFFILPQGKKDLIQYKNTPHNTVQD
jgi:hypothetical protein